MKYFSNLPLIIKAGSNNNSLITTNLLSRSYILPSLLKNVVLFYEYDVKEGDSPENIAYRYYGDVYRYWLILYSNNIIDPQSEWPLNSNDFQRYIFYKYREDVANGLFIPVEQVQVPPLRFVERDPLDNMPILERNQFGNENPAPIPNRGPEYKNFLAASVKIGVSNASGSGTIVYYDSKTKIAYVATCGHLWTPGIMEVEAGKKKALKCKVITWYHNDKKLDAPKTYDADVIFYSYIDGQDTALISFKPDWEPNYFPLGPADYTYKVGQHGHSCGCDAGSEVAHYDIKFLGIQGADLVTTENSPRPGRSGGGLMNDEGKYIGTCWGTQYRDGTGKGYFTPLSVIHKFWKIGRAHV